MKKTYNSSFRMIKNIGIVSAYRISARSMYNKFYILALIVGRILGFAILLIMLQHLLLKHTFQIDKILFAHNFFLPRLHRVPMVLVTRELSELVIIVNIAIKFIIS